MVLRAGTVEGLVFLVVVIYMAKVLVVMSYLDASETGLLGQADMPGDRFPRVKEDAAQANPKVRSILQDNQHFLITKKAEQVDEGNKQNVGETGANGMAKGDNQEGGSEENGIKEKSTEEEVDFAGMNADFFAEVLKLKYDHASKCSEESLFLLLIIHSKPENLEFRMTIRETWANAPDAETQGVLAMFVVGKPKDGPDLEDIIIEENERYDDIILGNFLDGFRNSTLKTLTGLKWVSSHCSSAKYIFMGDDHMYLNMDKMVRSLRSIHIHDADKSMWRGRTRTSSKVVRDKQSIFYVSRQVFARAVFPTFCTVEAGFVLSMSAVHEVYRESFDRSILPFGDVFIGSIADELKWDIVEDDLFNYRDYDQNICDLSKVVTLRGFSKPELIRNAFDQLHNETFLRNCPDPDLDLVLSNTAENGPYLDTVLTMLHDHPKYCFNDQGGQDNVFMLNLISSLPRNFESRQAIRETWGGQHEVLGEHIKTLFVMGLTQQDTEEIQQKVQEEDDEYGDVIQANFRESFQNLTLKVVLGLKWVTENCPHASYIYKGDDDMFVNFPNIISYVKKARSSGNANEKYFMGSVLFRSVRVTRQDSKYFVNAKFYSGRYFPPYCSGGGYVLSSDIVSPMYEQALKTAFIPIDDAYQGILAKKIGVVPQYNGGFKNWGEKSDTCSLRREELMTIHGFKDPHAMREVWKNFTDTSTTCGRR